MCTKMQMKATAGVCGGPRSPVVKLGCGCSAPEERVQAEKQCGGCSSPECGSGALGCWPGSEGPLFWDLRRSQNLLSSRTR